MGHQHMNDNRAPPQEAVFRAVLYPHRSLDPRGFTILMSAVGAVSFVAGVLFWAMGAWPVFGFFGLDVLLIYVAFRLNYRAGRLSEVIELTSDHLQLTRIHPSGKRDRFEFNPYWVRVRVADIAGGRTDLRLTSHGRELPFGRFLTDDERREFAETLTGQLIRARKCRPA